MSESKLNTADKNHIYRSSISPAEIDPKILGQNLSDVLEHLLTRKFPDSKLIDSLDGLSDIKCTYRDLFNLGQNLKCEMRKLGITDKVLVHIVSENNVCWGVLALSCIFNKTVFSTSHFKAPWGEIKRNSDVTKSSFVIISQKVWNRIKNEVIDIPPHVKQILVVSAESPNGLVKTVTLEPLLANLEFQKPVFDQKELENVLCILMSSGTTGTPKPIKQSRTGLLNGFEHFRFPGILSCDPENLGKPGNAVLVVQPMTHTGGLFGGLLFTLGIGSNIVLHEEFNPKTFMKLLEKYQISMLFTVNQIMKFMAYSCADYKVESINCIAVGGQKVTAEVARYYEVVKKATKNDKADIKTTYGMTEYCGFLTIHNGSYLGAHDPTSVGVIGPFVEMKFVSMETGKICKTGEQGEIYVRGPAMTPGIFNDPEKSKEMFDHDGFLRTGDLGYINEKGEIYITSRIKDVIKVRGFTVAPGEIEEAAMSHPGVVDCLAVGEDNGIDGELPVLGVVWGGDPNHNEEETAREIKDTVASLVAEHKRVSRVVFLKQIPTSGSLMKKDSKRLKKMVSKGSSSFAPSLRK